MKASQASEIKNKVLDDKKKQVKVEKLVVEESIKKQGKIELAKIYKEIKAEAAKGCSRAMLFIGVRESSRGYQLGKDEFAYLEKQPKGYNFIDIKTGKFNDVGAYVLNKLEQDGYTFDNIWAGMDINYGYEDEYGYQSHTIGTRVCIWVKW